MKRIAVLMTCYNRVQTTQECLRRLFAQEVPIGYTFDVWLVDDASPDKTGEKVKEAFPQVNVIRGTGKLFWCKGMRLAWEKAAAAEDYDGYLWLNDDVMLNKNALCSLLNDFADIKRVCENGFAVVGTCSNAAESNILTYGCYDGKMAVLHPCGTPKEVSGEYMMSGNVVLVSKAAFKRIGFICDGYLHAYGDSDYRQLMLKHSVPMYCSSLVVGICPKEFARYHKPEDMRFLSRFKLLFDPKGKPIRDVFLYRRRFWGLSRAVVSVLHVTWITLFPNRKQK